MDPHGYSNHKSDTDEKPMTHSPEPWTAKQTSHMGTGDSCSMLVDANTTEVFEVGNQNREDGSYLIATDADLDRIVSCVNACRHLPTDFLKEHSGVMDTVALVLAHKYVPRRKIKILNSDKDDQ